MSSALARVAVWVLCLAACRSAAPAPTAPVTVADAPVSAAPDAAAAPGDAVAARAVEADVAAPARAAEAAAPLSRDRAVAAAGYESAAVAPPVWVGDSLIGAFATPGSDQEHAALHLVAWHGGGVRVLYDREVPGVVPGAAMGLLTDASGVRVVWRSRTEDGGARVHTQPCTATSCEAPVRPADATETEATLWTVTALQRRSREGTQEVAPEATGDGFSARVERLRTVAVARVDGIELARSGDLLGYQRALAAAAQGATRWVALSRGQCADNRVELYRIAGGAAARVATWPIGVEVGVRWMRVEPHPAGRVAVSWYQDLIPLRIACTRGDGAPTVEHHGLRVAVYTP